MIIAATSAAVKQEHQHDICPYCSSKIDKSKWKIKLLAGLEREINSSCPNGHELRRKVSKELNIDQLTKIHSLDWGEEVKVNTNY